MVIFTDLTYSPWIYAFRIFILLAFYEFGLFTLFVIEGLQPPCSAYGVVAGLSVVIKFLAVLMAFVLGVLAHILQHLGLNRY
jgi:hypothetical protein